MKNLRQISILIFAFLLLTNTTPTIAQSLGGEADPSQITQELASLEPYVQYIIDSDEIRLQEFNADAALEDGFSEEVVLLAKEIVAFQNDMAKAVSASGIKDVTQLDVSLQKYPRAAKFFAQMTQQLESSNNSTPFDPSPLDSDPPPCGNWDYPVPNNTPTRYSYSSPNPEQSLLNLGFHRTVPYACESDCYNNDGVYVDFTKGRGYSGPYGDCSSPRFRNHGRIEDSSTYKIQFGEPNPEVLSYSWPYWNWGFYCRWWHHNF
ncbi:MAG: hypothetical protein K8R40_02090 [Anaerolineaceae bacterium]|nr:hypothetical protein [Anaerolineaceae bacterium]